MRLTIAIPTYNRAEKLDAQLAWAERSIGARWDECELVVLDNCSPDGTPGVVAKWRERLGDRLRSVRHEKNIGLCGNIAAAWMGARGEFVWAVGDDDWLADEAVAAVLDRLRAPGLTLLHLNHRCVSGLDGSVVFERYYPWDAGRKVEEGRRLLQECLCVREGALMFITALVIRRESAAQALNAWPEATLNLAMPLWCAACAALDGAMAVTGPVLCECTYFVSSWVRKAALVELRDVPIIYERMKSAGYEATSLEALLRRRFRRARVRQALKLGLQDLRGAPTNLARLARYRFVRSTAGGSMPQQDSSSDRPT